MNKKKTTKSKAAKSMKNLPAKPVNAKTAKGVKAGITFKTWQPTYTPQK